jgi:hypothetical protein
MDQWLPRSEGRWTGDLVSSEIILHDTEWWMHVIIHFPKPTELYKEF